MKNKLGNISLIVFQVVLVAGIVFALNNTNVHASLDEDPPVEDLSITDNEPGTPPQSPQSVDAVDVKVAAKITYQGVLEVNGIPLDGGRNMEFHFYTNKTCSGAAAYVYAAGLVSVKQGVFSAEIPIGQNYLNGQGVWLRVKVGSRFIGCEEILPVPYAYSLRPGAEISGTPTDWYGWVLKTQMWGTNSEASAILGQTATGYAVKGNSENGTAVYGITENGIAVYGWDGGTANDRGIAGAFYSSNGIGLSVTTNSNAHYNHAGNFYANGGYGIYANSANNTGVRGEIGTPAELSGVPTWTAGIVGRGGDDGGVFGGSRDKVGVAGNSVNDAGVYGNSTNLYGVYGYSANSNGVYGSSPSGQYAGYFYNRQSNTDAGLYVRGYFIATGSKTGYVADIARNEGDTPLETGDVVMIVGADAPVVGEIPLILVKLADAAQTSAVAGIVDQPFAMVPGDPTLANANPGDNMPVATAAIAAEQTGTAAGNGEYVSIVTLGSYKTIKVDASFGAISPGDILVASSNPGYAMRTDNPQYGSIIGKALGELTSGTGTIPVLVTLD